jgi:peptidyl-dipeptidase A
MRGLKHPNIVWNLTIAIAIALASVSCEGLFQNKSSNASPTVADAERFIADTENLLADLSAKAERASWVQANFITGDTEVIASQAKESYIEATTKLAGEIKRFDGMQLPPVLDRKFKLLKLSLFSLGDPKEIKEVAALGFTLKSEYSTGKACPEAGKYAGKCLSIAVRSMTTKTQEPSWLRCWSWA